MRRPSVLGLRSGRNDQQVVSECRVDPAPHQHADHAAIDWNRSHAVWGLLASGQITVFKVNS